MHCLNSHLFMSFDQVLKLSIHAVNLVLQVYPGKIGIINHLIEGADLLLHCFTERLLMFKPEKSHIDRC